MSLKRNWLNRNLIGFSAASFFNDFSHEMTTIILPSFVQSLVGIQQAPYVLGLMSGISNAVGTTAKLLSGWLSDRISRHKWLLIIGYALTPLFSSLIGTAQFAWQVITYRAIAWLGRGMREPARDLWLSKIVDKEDYGKAFGFQRACDTLGALGGPITVFFILNYVSLPTIFFISLIPGIFSVLSIILLTHEASDHQKPSAISLYEQYKLLPTSFIYFLMTRFVFGMGDFNKVLIILRAQEVLSIQSSSSYAITWTIVFYTLFNVIRAISEYGIGALSDYMNRKNLLALVGFGLFGITCILLIFASSIVWWLLIFTVLGISTAALTSLEKSYTAQIIPEHVRGTGYGLLEVTDGIGKLISSIIVGNIWSSVSASYGFAYSAILSLIAMILLLVRR